MRYFFVSMLLLGAMFLTDYCQAQSVVLSKKITFKSFSLKYHIHNVNSPKTIFLIHGFGDTHDSFKGLFHLFDSLDYRIVYYDLAGMGENKVVKLSFEEQIALFSAIVKKEKTTTNILIGHSMGGLIGLLSATTTPQLYEHIITIEPSITKADSIFFAYTQPNPIGIGVDSLVEKHKAKGGYSDIYHENLLASNRDVLKNHALTIYNNFTNYRLKILQSHIAFVYLYGTESSYIDLRKQMSIYPQVQVYAVEKAKHWAHIDNPKQFSQIFLNQLK